MDGLELARICSRVSRSSFCLPTQEKDSFTASFVTIALVVFVSRSNGNAGRAIKVEGV